MAEKVSTPWHIEPLELFDARQALRIGTYRDAKAALDRLPEAFALAEDSILVQLEVLNAEGDLLALHEAATRFLAAKGSLSPEMTCLLELVQARCKMMTDMAMSDYLHFALETWQTTLKDVNLEDCGKTALYLEAEFHRGMHTCVHFTYNANSPAERPRHTSFGTEDLPNYPMPFSGKDAGARLVVVSRRHLQCSDPQTAFGVYTLLVSWHTPDEVDSSELLQEILSHGASDALLTARLYIQNATLTARRETFEVANILISEARNCVNFLGEASEYANQLRLVEAKMAFIAVGGLNALSGTMASMVIENEHLAMIRDFMQAQQYSLAAQAVTQYMDCVDYITRPTHVNDVLELSDAVGAKSGNTAYMWTTRLIALGSTPLKAHIALGRQSVWCRAFLGHYAESGAWELSRRFALYFCMYHHRIGDWAEQLYWSVAAGGFEALVTNDPESRLSSYYQTFTVMIMRLQNLAGEDAEDERPEVLEYGIDGFQACEEAGLKDLSRKFLIKLSNLGVKPETLLRTPLEDSSLAVTPLGEPMNLEAEELLELYIKQRDLLDRLLDHELASKAFELHSQLEAYMEPIYEVLRHGTALKLRIVDYAVVHNAMDLRLARGILRIGSSATFEQGARALEIAKATAARCEEIGELQTQREALFVAAQWAFRQKEPDWGREVVDLLYRAEDCMDLTRTHVTAVSRMDSLDNKQRLVASFGRSDVYTFGYMVMAALHDCKDRLAIISPGDRITTKDVWMWTQRGKGRSVMDLIYAAEAAADAHTEDTLATTLAVKREAREDPPEKKASLAAEIGNSIRLEDVQAMADDYAANEPGSAMVLVDWFVASSHIDMIIVDAAGQIHTEILDFTLENAMKSLMRQPLRLRSADDVRAWKDAYLGQSEFLGDVLTTEALAELDWLVEPLEKHSRPGDMLVFCPSGVLHGLPLHALSVGGRCLVERNPVLYTGSLSLLLACFKSARSRGAEEASTSVVFGVFGRAGQEAGDKSVEESKVEEMLAVVSSSLGTKAAYGISPDDFIERCRGQHIIHYHGHAVLGKAKQSRFCQSLVLSGEAASADSNLLQWDEAIDDSLLLSGPVDDDDDDDDGDGDDKLGASTSSAAAARLTARDMIARLQLSAAHVTLIACNSASQELSAGDEPQGMIPVLLLCGAASVLGTLWPILSSDGRAFSEEFYRPPFGEQGSVVNLARAMQRGVLAIRAARPEPIHWAGFVLHGAWFHKC